MKLKLERQCEPTQKEFLSKVCDTGLDVCKDLPKGGINKALELIGIRMKSMSRVVPYSIHSIAIAEFVSLYSLQIMDMEIARQSPQDSNT